MGKSILLVEDNRLARMMLNSVIAEFKPEWSVAEAHSAEDAMDIMAEHKDDFDVILIDVGLPGMDGLELASKLRDKDHNAELAVITANIQKPVRERAEKLGATFIEKPLKAEDLLSFLSKVEGQ